MSVRTSLATRRDAQIFGPPRTPVLQAAVTITTNNNREMLHAQPLSLYTQPFSLHAQPISLHTQPPPPEVVSSARKVTNCF